ncbi:MAG: NusA-like transcription termination signal-binding factor [Nitrososphaerota archaeon]|nr:NusA-like transcription termination signal-binding factor [Nitrososphaerota archaeon]MDG6927766.1 NusA-like transcription termination signal-binding factor [Nitrososphaerota archaeon]MDG6930305.1 NusA-like transcription termination signal-binding factor [Nitrososphaerota archaeon]MDG6932728.1 NusA-like transcription termination signal-binding factor [Nitrososphaerota archaeon]MDG6935351.1 NusA-like transcription termination signal-binding factor [Nitrososphaerota archaeon]
MSDVKYTIEDLNFMKLFQAVSGIYPRDILQDQKFNRTIIVVDKGSMGASIGKSGQNIIYIKKVTGKDVVVVEYSDNMQDFIKGLIGQNVSFNISESTNSTGVKQVTISVSPESKGLVFGIKGQNIEKIKLLLKRYFNVAQVKVI